MVPFLSFVLMLLALLVGAVTGPYGREARGAASLERSEVNLIYRTRLTGLPAQAQKVEVWIPLARSSREQEILAREIETPVPYRIEQDPDYGNEILHLGLVAPFPQELEVEVAYRAKLPGNGTPSYDAELSNDHLDSYMKSQGLLVIDDEVRRRTQEAVEGRSAVQERARGIYDHVLGHMSYDKTVPGWGRGDTARACLVGKGNCTDFHSLFISMARAAEIPARFKIGMAVPPEGSGPIPGYHCWAEFYAEEEGWVTVDASEAWKLPAKRDYYFGHLDSSKFLISMGRDIRLVPMARHEPVNIFFYPHVEVDGEVYTNVETEFWYQHKEKEEML